MATIKQTFSLIGRMRDLSETTAEYNEMLAQTEEMMFTQKEAQAYQRKLENKAEQIETKRVNLATSSIAYGISTAAFVYNYEAKTTRFGIRGRDIQDQLKLQDKLVNKAFGVLGATVVGGVGAGALALVSTVVSEVISVNIQNQAYNYRREIDAEQKQIAQERIGRATYNSSRRS